MHGDRIIGGMSVYADRKLSTKQRTVFRKTKGMMQPGQLVLSSRMKRWAKGAIPEGKYVMVNPHVKVPSTCAAKDWGWTKWVELAERLPPDYLLQCDYGFRILPNVRVVSTMTFDHAAALLTRCRGILTTEGGMHHAAGALHKPAVVIFGGTNPPSVLGYDFHTNLAVDDPKALGWRCYNADAAAAMDRITVDMVYAATKKNWPW